MLLAPYDSMTRLRHGAERQVAPVFRAAICPRWRIAAPGRSAPTPPPAPAGQRHSTTRPLQPEAEHGPKAARHSTT